MLTAFAPLEGITGRIYRLAHHDLFPGVDRYYTPFFAPTEDCPLTDRWRQEVLPEHNNGICLVPQLLTNRADAFLAAAQVLQAMGYREVNLNLGCPSGTVFSKKKGAGFLTLPQELDRFLDTVCSKLTMGLSVKTRIGVENLEEWPALLEIYNRYPLTELIVHPRLRRDFYRASPHLEAFQFAVDRSTAPLCYNGNLMTPTDCAHFSQQFPQTDRLMFGRGLVANPALVRNLRGGPPPTSQELHHFHDRLLEDYREALSGDHPVLGTMKELWYYMASLFAQPAPYLKAMRKARNLTDYTFAAEGLFRACPLLPGAGFRPPTGEVSPFG